MTTEDATKACAGWLAVAGYEHLQVRLSIALGQLPEDVLAPQPGWPPLFDSFEAMVATQADD